MQLRSFGFGCEAIDARSGVVHIKALALLFGGERIFWGVRGRVTGDDFHYIAAVGQQARLKRVVLFRQPGFEQLPFLLLLSAIVERVNQVIVVFVAGNPADADIRAVALRHRSRLDARGRGLGKAGTHGDGLRARSMRSGWKPGACLHIDIVHDGRDVFGQIVDCNFINPGGRCSRLQYGTPLHEARRRNLQPCVFVEVDPGPWAPIAIGIINVTAAGEELEVAMSADFGAPPARKNADILYITFKCAVGGWSVVHQEDFAQIAAGAVESAVRRAPQASALLSAGLHPRNQPAVLFYLLPPAFTP